MNMGKNFMFFAIVALTLSGSMEVLSAKDSSKGYYAKEHDKKNKKHHGHSHHDKKHHGDHHDDQDDTPAPAPGPINVAPGTSDSTISNQAATSAVSQANQASQ